MHAKQGQETGKPTEAAPLHSKPIYSHHPQYSPVPLYPPLPEQGVIVSPSYPPPASSYLPPGSVTTYTSPYPYFSGPPLDGSSVASSSATVSPYPTYHAHPSAYPPPQHATGHH